ncbi:hypothetical protein [Streptomyces sp. DG1A-41]|uniref:hypothetical protein n=1 Tax=Streptomyces sp. DG1A-41 TaxID=3125779 RepID=UPI0030CDB9BF
MFDVQGGTDGWSDAQPEDPEPVFSGTDDGTEKWCNANSGSFIIEHMMGMNVDPEGTVDVLEGRITVGGTVTCIKPASVSLNGHVFQIQKKETPGASYQTTVACTPGAPVPWAVSLTSPEPGTSFQPGHRDDAQQGPSG